MIYEYTVTNRLDNPHKYMYTPYQGKNFVNAYFKNRLENITRLQAQSNKSYSDIDLHFCAKSIFQSKELLNREVSYWEIMYDFSDISMVEDISPLAKYDEVIKLKFFKLENEIETEKLLSSLLFSQLDFKNDRLIKEWLDRLIQKFEVTKKLYSLYPKGFKAGKGKTNIVRLYWMFSLLLSLRCVEKQNVKYLSTLLKVNDLLCSLDNKILLKHKIPEHGLMLVLLVEMAKIRSLSRNIKRGNFVFK